MQVPSSNDEMELEETSDQPSYEMERILRWREKRVCRRLKQKFYVLWCGCPIEEASWIPKSNFDDLEILQQNLLEDNPTKEI